MIALIITQGPGAGRRALRRLAATADLVLAADGGARLAREAGIVPALIVGDGDSLDPATRRWGTTRAIARRRFPVAKSATDAELALDEAVRRGATDVWVYSVWAGRLDQALANVLLLFAARRRGVRARLTDGAATAQLAEGTVELRGRRGDLVSLIPLSPLVRGITTAGLRYPLRRGVLRRGTTRGISNELVGTAASVRASSGDLLVVSLPAWAARPRRGR